ncbi:hypothetical protein [Acinetobacter sp.]|jgi:hypothetical protein|uniref:hypothetical protein n=1 Tax=Acinetobacter sp. TaxID=472 RepID=UPI002821750F|nr:hypothetical protein [Acinetobacter sp.]MDR0237799.1 hypothetical protein [Acinetobacter sp.]
MESKIEALEKSCKELNFEYEVLENIKAKVYIDNVLLKFKPERVMGHLSLGDSYDSVPTDECEFTFSIRLDSEPAYIFFEQYGLEYEKVFILKNGRMLGEMMMNTYGMEYFISNERIDYLISVNWYVIEFTDSIKLKFNF